MKKAIILSALFAVSCINNDLIGSQKTEKKEKRTLMEKVKHKIGVMKGVFSKDKGSKNKENQKYSNTSSTRTATKLNANSSLDQLKKDLKAFSRFLTYHVKSSNTTITISKIIENLKDMLDKGKKITKKEYQMEKFTTLKLKIKPRNDGGASISMGGYVTNVTNHLITFVYMYNNEERTLKLTYDAFKKLLNRPSQKVSKNETTQTQDDLPKTGEEIDKFLQDTEKSSEESRKQTTDPELEKIYNEL